VWGTSVAGRRLGRVLGPLLLTAATSAGAGAAIAAAAAASQRVGIERSTGGTPTIPAIPPAPPGVNTGPVPEVPVTPTAPTLAERVIGLPAATGCVKSLRVRLIRPKGVHLRSLSVFIGRRHVTRRHVPQTITFHELPNGHFTLKVTVTTTTDRKLTRSRRYDRCG
jgi:hypothetical protein